MFKNHRFYKLHDVSGFIQEHSNNRDIVSHILQYSGSMNNLVILVNSTTGNGGVERWSVPDSIGISKSSHHNTVITHSEFVFFHEVFKQPDGTFESDPSNEMQQNNEPQQSYGKMKVIITYMNGETIEEEGVTSVKLNSSRINYQYNRKKLGFIKYNGEVELEFTDLKQITIDNMKSVTVLHIENGVIEREHVMYDETRKFTTRKYSSS